MPIYQVDIIRQQVTMHMPVTGVEADTPQEALDMVHNALNAHPENIEFHEDFHGQASFGVTDTESGVAMWGLFPSDAEAPDPDDGLDELLKDVDFDLDPA